MEGSTPTCYRHHSRQTGVSCSNCGRPICPECMTSTSVGMRCPECAGKRTAARRGVAALTSGADPIVTYVLIAINLIAYLAEIGSGAGAASLGGGGVIRDYGLLGPAIEGGGEWYRLITGGFLHAGLFHVGLNMFALYVLGGVLEPAIGPVRFLAVYFTSLLAGSLGALLLEPTTITVGASGAVYGLLSATILIARRRGLHNVASQLGLWLGLNLVLSFSISGISVGGHLGGLVGGAIAAAVIIAAESRAGRRGMLGLELTAMTLVAAGVVAGAVWAAGRTSGIL